MKAALLLTVIIWSSACSHAPPSEDHLTVEAGPFGRYGVSDEYESALARLLLPESHREVQMVWIPSFSGEGSVFIVETSHDPVSYRVIAMTMKTPLSAEMSQRLAARVMPDGRIPFGPDDQRRAIEEMAPVAVRTDAPISPATVAALKAVWRAALLDARHPAERKVMVLDGVTFYFADWTLGVGYRTGVKQYPASGRIDELVSLGRCLAEYAGADPSRRPALEAELVGRAEKLRARF